MTQFRIRELLVKANYILDKGFHIMPGLVIIKNRELEDTLDKIDGVIPEDVKEAERIMNRRDAILMDAQNRAERIISDAQSESERILSESELLKAVQQEATKVREQVIANCEEIKEKAMEDAMTIREQAMQDAMRIKEGATNYTEQILGNLETDLAGLQQIVRNGQVYLEQQKAECREQQSQMQQQMQAQQQAMRNQSQQSQQAYEVVEEQYIVE